MAFRPDHPASFASPSPQYFQFIGKGGEYFRIWIVNLLLSILTLGIYSAWAKVRRERYFCSHTLLAGSPFYYHGKASAILKGRILAVLILVGFNVVGQINPMFSLAILPLFLIAMPWAVRTSLRFRAANTSWRGVHFTFTASMKESVAVIFGWGLLNLLTLGLTLPASLRRWHKYIFNNLTFGGKKFDAAPPLGGYYEVFIIPSVLIAGTILLVVAIVSGNYTPDAGNLDAIAMQIAAIVAIVYIVLPLIFFAYVNVRIRNLLLDNVLLGRHGLGSDMRVRGLVWVLIKHGFLTLLTCGLYLPALQIALTRYRVDHMILYPFGSIEDFVAERLEDQRALGEELTDILDMDLGF